jgi:magnesium transporter
MEEASEVVLAGIDQEEAARMLSKYDLVVLPVVDEFHHLLGVLTYDDAMEILQEESTEDIEKLAAIAGDQSEVTYLNTGVYEHLRRRVLWLVLLAFVSMVSGYVLFRFETVLEQAFVLTMFLPMVVAAGGNAGGQAATMVVRAMALGEITPGSALRIAGKEARTGLMLGLALGISIALFITFILPLLHSGAGLPFDFPHLALAVSTAITLQVLSSTVLGAMLPITARGFRLDPAVVSAPSLASIVDVTGMFIYFVTASVILGI